MESFTDLLIVGAGPAGLMLAAWASQFNVSARLIDNQAERTGSGHADGLHSRTLEILDSFDVVDGVLKDAYRVNELASWNPDPHNPNYVKRTARLAAQPHDLSRFPQVSLNQGLTEQVLLDYLDRTGRVRLERSTRPESLVVDDGLCDSDEAHPITLTIRNTANGCAAETVRAKYVVGCDGAHSWVRKQLGIRMEGEHTNKHFGVMDIVPLTDFPDIRLSCIIHSNCGSIMTVPREHRLVRLYVQLGETKAGERSSAQSATPQTILDQARSVMRPYSLDFRICDWQSVYTIGQRVASRFSYRDRIFLCGDAVHTHSPMMGQGMNVSMQDSFNLGWKLGSVLEGSAKREILTTYEAERRSIALQLIELDREMAEFYSHGPSEQSREYQKYREGFGRFLSGVAVKYGPGQLVSQSLSITKAKSSTNGAACSHASVTSDPERAKGVTIGQRMPSLKVVCQAEANVIHLADVLPSNGRWRVVVFAGDLTTPQQWEKTQALGELLGKVCRRYTGGAERTHSAIEVLLIHSGARTAFDILRLHDVYHPWDETLGWDYWKVFADDAGSMDPGCKDSQAYHGYGVDMHTGCVVVLRPDHHVSYIGSLEDGKDISTFFEGVLLPQRKSQHEVNDGSNP
ncbi:hypothetical protein BAUCODRAFT_124812 [Baudoinia panamericana UAMH 10762]|uniref:FAD-binding domain-containing protein n=1 Tax=Baudoinia panamericana (strain UAMH 10762) TaxID=717646 RepID=M2N4Y4_BAUPA|nr:uncharacterized protein BAUCODRAFT_124812 [Baudoinia panamericana UAMH 10762]EMC94079.1 hypothetical protein BAUCODRAFT_124812 [Baudoinia panamericana UAMH 10762]